MNVKSICLLLLLGAPAACDGWAISPPRRVVRRQHGCRAVARRRRRKQRSMIRKGLLVGAAGAAVAGGAAVVAGAGAAAALSRLNDREVYEPPPGSMGEFVVPVPPPAIIPTAVLPLFCCDAF